MPRLLEEARGQRNPTEEKRINEEAERRRAEAEAKKRQESWSRMVDSLPRTMK